MVDDPTWVALTTDGSTACAFTSAGIKVIKESVYQIRPVVTGLVPEARADIYLLLEKS